MNPIGNVFCSRCNARLLSTEMKLPERPKPAEEAPAGVKGISLPTLPAAKDGVSEPEALPDWLLELTEQSLRKPVGSPEVAEPAPADQFPDWLSGVVDVTADDTGRTADSSTASKGAPELPDWFDELAAETLAPQEVAPETSAADATTDWFADLLEDTPAEIPEVEAEAAREEEALEELPDWLSELTPEEPAAAPAAAAFDGAPSPPERATGSPVTEEPAPVAVAELRAALPDWLLATAAPTPAGEHPISQPMPEWLLKNAEEPAPHASAARQLPAWLAKGTTDAEPEEKAAPDWLTNLYPAEEAELQAAAVPVQEPTTEGAPDWLLGVFEDEDAEPQQTAPAAEATPDWLLGIYEGEEAAPQAAVLTLEPEEEAFDADAPDWLAGIYGAEEAEPLSAAFTAEPEEETAPATDAPEMDIPDWLAGVLAEEPPPAQPQAPSTKEAPEEPAAQVAPPASSLDAEYAVFTGAGLEELADGDATPDWLRDASLLDDEEVDSEAAKPAFITREAASAALEDDGEELTLETGEVPDWLKGLSPDTSGLAAEPGLHASSEEDESLVRAEVPGWLQGLRPPGTGDLPPLPEVVTPGMEIPMPQEGGLARAEIPDWVQQLRPAPTAEGEAGEKRILEPAETEGPLAGLRGVLPLGILPDMPADFQPAAAAAIPDSVVAQAQLWQQLLEQPRSVQRPVAQHHARSGRGQLLTRLIVAAFLLAATALGLLWSDAPLSQAISQPHIERFSRAIDALDPGATVIVAVEYGPAEAGEMTLLAQTVVQHLADRNARVMMVSTLPEGSGLIHSLLEPQALANHLPPGRNAYLSGSSSGVAQFLAEPDDAELLIVLTGRAERLRWWVEQNNAKQILPMTVGLNAATAPLAAPYLETAPVVGWVTGFPDVVAYREFRGLTSSALNSQLDALLLTHWAALALLLFGLFYYLALGKRGAA